MQRRGVVDRAVVVIWSGVGDKGSGGRARRRRYVGGRCLVRVIASSRRLSSLCGGMKIGLAARTTPALWLKRRHSQNFDMTPRNQLKRLL